MKRRRVCMNAAVLLAWPLRLAAQTPPRSARIGFSIGGAPSPITQRTIIDPFVDGLRDAGFVAGRNLVIDFRWAEGKPERLPGQIAELLVLKPDLILANGPAQALAAKKATTTVPIVAVPVDDPVLMGLVTSMARPGGNITGVSGFGGELVARRLQLLKDFVPQARRFAVLANPAYLKPEQLREFLGRLEPQLGKPLSMVLASGLEQYAAAFDEMQRLQVDGVVVLADSTTWLNRERLHELVLAHRLPSIWGGGPFLGEAGLASYQSDFAAAMRRAAAMAAQILNGAKPGDIPFEQSTKLELVLNLKAARALGIEVPTAVRIAADEVIE